MAEQVLMEKLGEQMNVPAARVDEFLANGWVIIKRAESVVLADVPLAMPEEQIETADAPAEPVETAVPPAPKPRRLRRKEED